MSSGFTPDPLTDLLRQGAPDLIAQAVLAALNAPLARHAQQTDLSGHGRLVRHGHLPERKVQTGIGAVAVKVPRVRDRAPKDGRLQFTATMLPPYLRRAKSIKKLLPGFTSRAFSGGISLKPRRVPLGPDAPGLSASTITRLKTDG